MKKSTRIIHYCFIPLKHLNPLSTNVPLLQPLQTSKNLPFSDFFRGYRSGTLVENRFILFFPNTAFFQFHKIYIVGNIEKAWTVIKEAILHNIYQGFECRWISAKLVCYAEIIVVSYKFYDFFCRWQFLINRPR